MQGGGVPIKGKLAKEDFDKWWVNKHSARHFEFSRVK